MALQDWLREQLPRWRSYVDRGVDEKNTEDKVISPLLSQLGWDMTDLDQVEAQVLLEDERVDYVLFNHDHKSLVMLEVKKISEPLRDGIAKGYIEPEKYKAQAKKLDVDLLVITNGLSFQFFARSPESGEFLSCDAIELDLGTGEISRERVESAAGVLALLSREALLDGASLGYIRAQIVREEARNKLIEALRSPSESIISVLADEMAVQPEVVRDAFSSLKLAVTKASELPPPAEPSLRSYSPQDRKLIYRMTDRSVGAKKWRQKVSKYLPVWRLFLEHDRVARSEILELVSSAAATVKGRAVFFGAYVGENAKTPIFERCPPGESEADSEEFRVRPELREAFETMVALMEKE